MRKDIKKSSYYVWFLGAQEAKGLRGSEYITPVIRSLVEREREVEPFKVTLQVSHKGLKIIQNVPSATALSPAGKVTGKSNGKTEVVKHFIPHHAVTCVLQDDDIVACILLLYNPVTKCPVHVHAYRCDSIETATILNGQLQTLIERPENQKKLTEIEARLRAKGLLLPSPPVRPIRRIPPPGGSDGRSTSTRESESSGGSSTERLSGVGQQERIASLYDSLAAELREKLGTGGPQPQAPILLPPRDYDTVHRQKGNLSGIDLRRCLNMNIVGVNVVNNTRNIDGGATCSKQTPSGVVKVGSSGGSSGIGSDHAPSPDHDSDARFLDNHSTSEHQSPEELVPLDNAAEASTLNVCLEVIEDNTTAKGNKDQTSKEDEDWNTEPSKDSLFLVQPGQTSWRGGAELSLPRARRHNSSGIDSSPLSPSSPLPHDAELFYRRRRLEPSPPSDHEFQSYHRGPRSHNPEVYNGPDHRRHAVADGAPEIQDAQKRLKSESTPHPVMNPSNLVQRRKKNAEERQRSPSPSNVKLCGPLTPRDRFNDAKEKFLSLERERQEEQEKHEKMQISIERKRQIEPPISPSVIPLVRSHPARNWSRSRDSDDEDDDFRYNEPVIRRESSCQKTNSRDSIDSGEYPARHHAKSNAYLSKKDDSRRNVHPSPSRHNASEDRNNRPVHRRYPSPRREQSPGRNERFDSPVHVNPRPAPRSYPEDCSPDDMSARFRGKFQRGHIPQVPFTDDNIAIPLERYRSPTRVTAVPRPAPRHQRYSTPNSEDEEEQLEYRHLNRSESRHYPPRPHFENNEKKRRSMYEALEDERRKNSNELAKEFKCRSYQEHSAGYQELEEHERYPGLDRETARIYNKGDRHSYAEPFLHHQQVLPHHHELLHRTNSSVSSGRVGIAAIHPY